jgi:cytochrome P450
MLNISPGFDFTDPGVYAERLPVEELSELRRTAPIWWNEQPVSEGFHDGGFWVVSKHHDVKQVSLRSDVFSSLVNTCIANGELFRIYPGDRPGRSVTVHQNSTPLDLSEESVAAGAQAVFDYAHATVRDEDYRLAQALQANLESGAHDHLLFGRNEPGLQHRHRNWIQALRLPTRASP